MDISPFLASVIPVIKKEPITVEILQKLHDKFVTEDAGLPIIRTMAISLVPRPRRGRGKSGLVTNVCACAEITKKTGNRILSVNS